MESEAAGSAGRRRILLVVYRNVPLRDESRKARQMVWNRDRRRRSQARLKQAEKRGAVEIRL
jgi:hypothetical protein